MDRPDVQPAVQPASQPASEPAVQLPALGAGNVPAEGEPTLASLSLRVQSLSQRIEGAIGDSDRKDGGGGGGGSAGFILDYRGTLEVAPGATVSPAILVRP